jgi:hypothetical protein
LSYLLQDIQCKTALHYAIQEHRFETTKLLLHFGADPFLGASITQAFYFDLATCSVCGTSMLSVFIRAVHPDSLNPDPDTDPDPAFQVKFLKSFDQKLQYTYVQATGEAFRLKKNIQHFKK